MSREIINIGANPGDKTGDLLRNAFIKINNNFAEVYSWQNTGITIYNRVINLSENDVATLSVPKILIPAPGVGKIINIFSIYVKLNVITPLIVDGQDLLISNGVSPVIYTLDTTRLESTYSSIWSLNMPSFLNSIEQNIDGNQPISVYLGTIGNESHNPLSGNATMNFYITYQVITI